MSYLGDCARVYVTHGGMAHLLAPGDNPGNTWPHANRALCKRQPSLFGAWLGTGSQGEYERAAELPLCSRCEHLAVTR